MASRTRARAPERPKQRPRARLEVDARRAQLLAVGLTAFSERSYEQVSIDELARAARVSKGLLFHYFPTKRDFYIAALAEASRQLLEETRPETTASPEEQLRVGLETYLGFVERRAPAYVALMRGGIGSDPEVFAILERTRAEFVRRILENLPPDQVGPLLRTALRGWIGFVEASALAWIADRQVDAQAVVELCLQVLLGIVQGAPAQVRRTKKNAAPRRGSKRQMG